MVHISILDLCQEVGRDLSFRSYSQLFRGKLLCHLFLYLSRYELSGSPPLALHDLGSSLRRYETLLPLIAPYIKKRENLKGENNLPALSI